MQNTIVKSLHFTRRERRGAILLCVFMLITMAVPEIQERLIRERAHLPPLPATWPAAALAGAQAVEPFPFDPNTANEEQLRSLGLPAKTARSILNYREKGGRFRKPEDFSKIYTLSSDDFQRLLPYVRIEGSTGFAVESYRKTQNPYYRAYPRDSVPGAKQAYPRKTLQNVDINTAGVDTWQSLPGIGAWRAERIAGFRDKLGGFVSPLQVGETYGLPDSVFQTILPYLKGGGVLKKVKVNTATMDELKAHPYISPKEAGKIAAHRVQNGPFRTLDELEPIFSGNAKWVFLKTYLDTGVEDVVQKN